VRLAINLMILLIAEHSMYQIPDAEIPINCVSIKIEFSAGTMIDYTTWIPAAEHKLYYGNLFEISFDNLIVQIILNDQILFEQPVGTKVTVFEYKMLDSDELQLKELKIKLVGISHEHHQNITNKGDAAVMLRIHNIWLEDLNLRQAIEDLGKCVYDSTPTVVGIPSEFMGQNGHQLLEFTTPVYRWLLDQYVKPSYYYN
jgi:hypothetical protein